MSSGVPSTTYWSRLEPRPKSQDFQRGLRAEVRDGLWFLTRQWQLGELTGEDAGSIVHAEMKWSTVPIRRFMGGRDNKLIKLDIPPIPPLETIVEHEKLEPSIKRRVQMGQNFERMFLGNSNINTYLSKFRQTYPLDDYAGTDKDVQKYVKFMKNRVTDGFKLKEALYISLQNNKLPVEVTGIPNENYVLQIAIKYYDWCQKTYDEPTPAHPDCWVPERLEYSFAISSPSLDGNGETVLTAPGYSEGSVDWYSFSLDTTVQLDLAIPSEIKNSIITCLPANVKFRGIPNHRWWDFEDENVSLPTADLSKREIGKMMIIDFALVGSNDWFVIPFMLKIGSLARVNSLIVTDVFGERLLVKSTDQALQDESDWSMFKISHVSIPNQPYQVANFLFLAPSLSHSIESPDVEKVHFLRDEMANMAWAVEQEYENELGNSISGYEANVKAKPDVLTPPQTDVLRYILQTKVPINWIPLIPVHKSGSNRSIDLQRGSMLGDPSVDDKAKGKILIPKPGEKYIIREEEIPREGVVVTRNFQYARWIDGSTHLWVGRRKTVGRGEGSSGLRYDILENS